MTKPFICVPHRQWLATSPTATRNHLLYCQDMAQQAIESDHWQDACQYAEAAFQCAGLLLDYHHGDYAESAIYFTRSAILLSCVYRSLDQNVQQRQVLVDSEQRLKQLLLMLSPQDPHPAIEDCRRALQQGLNIHHHCYSSNTDVIPCTTIRH